MEVVTPTSVALRERRAFTVDRKRAISVVGGLGLDTALPHGRGLNIEDEAAGDRRTSDGWALQHQRPIHRVRLRRSVSMTGRSKARDVRQVSDFLAAQANDPEAEWKQIQEKTFTRWCNQHLQKSGLQIKRLASDFDDGIKLVVLVESLSGKSLGKYNKVPKRLPQCLENVGMVLQFLQGDEGLRLVNIGNTDIVMDHNLKLVLGLVWHLILHYQVSMVTAGEEGKSRSRQSPKDMLLKWLREKLAPRQVRNLTTSWNDGTLIAALVDAVGPGLFPGHGRVDASTNLKTTTKAMQLAEDWLGVPQVLQPSDMCNPRVDEKSMMTYLSYFPKAELKEGAPVDGVVKCYGAALEGNVESDEPAIFTIDASGKLDEEEITWKFSGPESPTAQSELRAGNRKIMDVAFQAKAPGLYNVDVLYGGEAAISKPLTIRVVRPAPDARKVRCHGHGLQMFVSHETAGFSVDASLAGGTGLLQIGVESHECPAGKVVVEHTGDYVFDVRYVCKEEASVQVHVQWHGEHVPGSPFTVQSVPADL